MVIPNTAYKSSGRQKGEKQKFLLLEEMKIMRSENGGLHNYGT
jgi:hypothetical protein